MMMCISADLEGFKTENVEKLLVFKAFFEGLIPIGGRLTGRAGGVGEG